MKSTYIELLKEAHEEVRLCHNHAVDRTGRNYAMEVLGSIQGMIILHDKNIDELLAKEKSELIVIKTKMRLIYNNIYSSNAERKLKKAVGFIDMMIAYSSS